MHQRESIQSSELYMDSFVGVFVDTQPSHLGRRSPYIGSIAAFSLENQPGSANQHTAEVRGERPLNSGSGQTPHSWINTHDERLYTSLE
jgi:hypothetical protein